MTDQSIVDCFRGFTCKKGEDVTVPYQGGIPICRGTGIEVDRDIGVRDVRNREGVTVVVDIPIDYTHLEVRMHVKVTC